MADLVFKGQARLLNAGAMPQNYDLAVHHGDYVELYVSVADDDDEVIPLDDFTATGSLTDGTDTIDLECTFTDDFTEVRVYLSSADSAALDPDGEYDWEFNLVNEDADIRTYLEGVVVWG